MSRSTSSTRPANTKARSGWRATRPSTTATSATGRAPPAARLAEIDGITGASVGSGKTLKITVDITDALINAGYTVHVDTAAENGDDNPSEIVAPLDASASGKPIAGDGYVKAFKATF